MNVVLWNVPVLFESNYKAFFELVLWNIVEVGIKYRNKIRSVGIKKNG